MPIHRRTFIISVIVIVVVMCVAGVLAALLLNPDRYRSQLVSYLEAKTGREVEIGHLAVRWHSASIELYDFGVRNPRPFPPGYVFRARRVEARIRIAPLFHRRISIQSVALHDPVINVISDPDGLWNFENPHTGSSAAGSLTSALGTIDQITIVGGQLFGSSLIDPSDRPGPVVLEIYDLSASLVKGKLGALAAAQPTPVETGNLTARSLRFGSINVTGIRANVQLATKRILFDSVNVDAEGGRATGQLAFNLAGKNAQFRVDAKVVHVDVARLLASFSGARGKMTGTMHGEITLSGPIEHTMNPLAGIRGSGNLTVDNGELPGMNSDDSLKKMTRFRNASDAGRPVSAFSSFSSDLDLTGQRMTNRDIDVAFYGFDLDCAGHLDLDKAANLEYHGVAKVLKKQGFATNIFAELFHEARDENGKLVFPLRITGTLDNPKFSLVD